MADNTNNSLQFDPRVAAYILEVFGPGAALTYYLATTPGSSINPSVSVLNNTVSVGISLNPPNLTVDLTHPKGVGYVNGYSGSEFDLQKRLNGESSIKTIAGVEVDSPDIEGVTVTGGYNITNHTVDVGANYGANKVFSLLYGDAAFKFLSDILDDDFYIDFAQNSILSFCITDCFPPHNDQQVRGSCVGRGHVVSLLLV